MTHITNNSSTFLIKIKKKLSAENSAINPYQIGKETDKKKISTSSLDD